MSVIVVIIPFFSDMRHLPADRRGGPDLFCLQPQEDRKNMCDQSGLTCVIITVQDSLRPGVLAGPLHGGRLMNIRKGELLLLSICHLLVDGVCAAVLLRDDTIPQLAAAILLYNTCAFTTQCLTGMLPDRFGHARLFLLLSALILAAGALLSMGILLQAAILGLGNSLFHVSGGYITLRGSRTMGPLGVFVAPGAVGLFLGTSFPVLRLPFVLLLLTLSVLTALPELRGSSEKADPGQNKHQFDPGTTSSVPRAAPYAALLLIAVSARAVGGSAVVFPWKTGLSAGIALTAAVFFGKTCGGFAADKLGLKKTALFSVQAASGLLILFPGSMILSLAGQFALNLSMPITLWLIFRLYPHSPGFAFGLAAAALWPGTLLGMMIHLTGIWSGLLTFFCFGAGLAAVLVTERKVSDEYTVKGERK